MIDETGIVTSINDTYAKIKVQKRGACEGCAASGVCEPSEDGMEIEALNPVLGKNLGEAYFKGIDSDTVSVVVGFAALIVSFLIARNWSKKVEQKAEYKPVIEKILE
jgi:positive regulator of sigma E activity